MGLQGLPENPDSFLVVIDKCWTMQQLREKLSGYTQIPPNLMRLRDHFNFRLGRVHKGNGLVGDCIVSMYDGKTLAIEEISEEEDLTDDDRVIRVVRYFPAEHKVGNPVQQVVKKTITLGELQTLLAGLGNFDDELIEIAKPFSSAQINDPDTMKKSKWRSYTNGENADMTLDKFQWMIFDADTFVYKNSAEDPNSNVTPDHSKVANPSQRADSPASGNPAKRMKYSRPEKSLKIKVSKEY